MKTLWSSYMARPKKFDIRKKLLSRPERAEQGNEAGLNASGVMFFHAYCIGAIEKYCADHGEHLRMDPEDDD